MNGGIEILPNQGVMFYISRLGLESERRCINECQHLVIFNVLLDKILLSNISSCQISDAINGNNSYIFNRAKKILNDLWKKLKCWENGCESFELMTELTLKEIKYLQTPDLLVDLISSSRWSRMTSLMYSYQARISVNSPNLPSRTLTLQGRNVNTRFYT